MPDGFPEFGAPESIVIKKGDSFVVYERDPKYSFMYKDWGKKFRFGKSTWLKKRMDDRTALEQAIAHARETDLTVPDSYREMAWEIMEIQKIVGEL